MITSDLIRELCDRTDIRFAVFCRQTGQTPQIFNKKLRQGTVSTGEMFISADILKITFEKINCKRENCFEIIVR